MDGPGDFRFPHLLERNIGFTSPHSFAFVDTESQEHPHPEIETKKLHKFRLGVASYFRLDHDKPTRRDSLEFTKTADFWAWLALKLDKRRPLYLFAHNAGFDLTMLGFWDLLDSGFFYLADDCWPLRRLFMAATGRKKPWRGSLVTEDAPTIVAVRNQGNTLKIVDTRNYFPVSLAKLGERVGIAKVPLPKFTDPDADWFVRCRADVRIIEAIVLDLILWWRRGKYGTWRNTAPGLAWNSYRHGFLDVPIEIHGHKKAIELERASYYGGECRSFFIGKVGSQKKTSRRPEEVNIFAGQELPTKAVYHLDTRSLYPFMMRGRLYPYKLAGYIPKCPLDRLQDVAAEHAFCCECVVKSEVNAWPVRVDNRTRYAVGTFRTFLAGPEALAAYACGDLVELGTVAYYKQADLFTRFVDHFWPLREAALAEGNETYALFYKLILNALPGKFAQRQWRWEESMDMPAPVPWGEFFHYDVDTRVNQLYRAVAFYTQKSYREGEANDSFPLIAAYVTAYARLHMRNLRRVAGERNVFYQDTDSLHVNHAGLLKLRAQPEAIGDGFGQLYLKGSHDQAEYFGLKHYRLDGKLTCGGAPKVESTSENRQDMHVKFTKLGAALAAGIPRSVTVSEHRFTPSLCHPDGDVGPDGWVIPLTLPNADPFVAHGVQTGRDWLKVPDEG